MSQEVQAHILKRYNLLKKVGSGAYGHVWKVTDKKSGATLALKKIFDAFQHSTDAQRTYRQIVFLHELDHPNIIRLHSVYPAENDKDLYLLFEYMEADLHNAIGQKILKDIHNRFIVYQLVKGIKFLHSAELLHRDLKPSNVLLNSDCVLKICDFGLARSLVADKEGADVVLTEEVATRWYRAPQVLLGSQNYDKSADMWSVGCIMAQMLTGKPIFPGNSTLNQLERILSFTGKPKKEDIQALNSEIAGTMIDSISEIKAKSIKDWFKEDVPTEAINLVGRLLTFNPDKRMTPSEVLRHPYLSKFHNPKQQIESPKVIYPPISDNKKLGMKQYRQLIYDRIKKVYSQKDDRTCSTNLSQHKSRQNPLESQESDIHQENQTKNCAKINKSSKDSNKENVDDNGSKKEHESQSNYTYQGSPLQNYPIQKPIRKQCYKSFIGSDNNSKNHATVQSQIQKTRPNSAVKQDDLNSNPGSQIHNYIQKSNNQSIQQLHKYKQQEPMTDDANLRKKNSLKEISRNRKQSPSLKQEQLQNYQGYSYNGLAGSSSHNSIHQKPSTAVYMPTNGSVINNTNLVNKFYKNGTPTNMAYKDSKIPMKY